MKDAMTQHSPSSLHRRRLLQAGAAALVAPLCTAQAQEQRRFDPRPGPWRQWELVTTVQVAEVKGATQLWLPIPDLDTDWQQSLGHSWTGNATQARIAADAPRGVRMLHAQFDDTVKAPTLVLTSRLQTRNRAVDWQRHDAAREDPALLRYHLQATELLPTDGIVRSTAHKVTQGARRDVDKVQAIYDWVVANAHREPKTRGCGTGDIKTMLESGNLGGKCADLNAVFVGLCRAAGVPARDVYGLRLAPSAFGYRELGANPANLKGAQHCRAEAYIAGHGWVAMDPADVLKVARQESSDWIKDAQHPLVAPVKKGLFGQWEGNWVGWNTAHDIVLPGTRAKTTLPFLMYPNGENAAGRFDELAPDSFKYSISAREIAV